MHLYMFELSMIRYTDKKILSSHSTSRSDIMEATVDRLCCVLAVLMSHRRKNKKKTSKKISGQVTDILIE